MKTLIYRDEEIQAEKIIKTSNALYGYVNNIRIFAFEGIVDFSAFQLVEEDEFDNEEPTLEAQIIELKLENKNLLVSLTEQGALIKMLMLKT